MSDPQKPAAPLRGYMRLYPELLLLEDPEDRKVVFKDCWRHVRRRKHLVTWGGLGGGFGGAVFGLVLVVFLLPELRRHVPLPNAAVGGIVGAVVGSCCMVLMQRIVHKPLQKAIRRALVERGIPVCVNCGYDLRGNVSGVCPECGKAI